MGFVHSNSLKNIKLLGVIKNITLNLMTCAFVCYSNRNKAVSQLYTLIYQSLLFTSWCTIELLQKNIKIYIKTAPTYFGSFTIIRERIIWAC